MKLLRLKDWYFMLGIPLLAALEHSRDAVSHPLSVLLVFAYGGVFLCSGYVFNNFFDREEDPESKNPFKRMQPRRSAILTAALQLLLLIVAFAVQMLPETVFVMALNGLYSMPPIRLKRYWVAALAINGIGFTALYYISVKILSGKIDTIDFWNSGFIFLIFLPLQYVHCLEHRESEGKPVRIQHKVPSALLYGMLCLTACFSSSTELAKFLPSTILYSALSLGSLVFLESAGRSRRLLRVYSIAFGAHWALMLSGLPSVLR